MSVEHLPMRGFCGGAYHYSDHASVVHATNTPTAVACLEAVLAKGDQQPLLFFPDRDGGAWDSVFRHIPVGTEIVVPQKLAVGWMPGKGKLMKAAYIPYRNVRYVYTGSCAPPMRSYTSGNKIVVHLLACKNLEHSEEFLAWAKLYNEAHPQSGGYKLDPQHYYSDCQLKWKPPSNE